LNIWLWLVEAEVVVERTVLEEAQEDYLVLLVMP
jgi:hypothetical protein